MNWVLFLVTLVIHNSLCGHIRGHNHLHGQQEREEDGSFVSRDHLHYDGEEHNSEFDHEAILGSTREAEEFDHLPPEEAKKRLAVLLGKIDRNNDRTIDKVELKQWILRSFRSLSEEESADRLADVDTNNDGELTWEEYLAETYDIHSAEEVDEYIKKQNTEERNLLKDDKELFRAADLDGNGKLNKMEFLSFSHPEEAPHMRETILKHTLQEKDSNSDGYIDFQEYIGEKGQSKDKVWLLAEKDKFDYEHDTDSDGRLSPAEILNWVLPNNEEIAEEEAEHLIASSDEDHDGILSFKEILDHHDVFVGSEATDFGDHLHNIHRFQDEL